MKDETTQQNLKFLFFLLSGAMLLTFFITTFVEGILAQTRGYSLVATTFYFVSMMSLGSAGWTYFKAKKTLRTFS